MNENVRVLTIGLSANQYQKRKEAGQTLNAIEMSSVQACQRCAKVSKSPLRVAEITAYLLNRPINAAPTLHNHPKSSFYHLQRPQGQVFRSSISLSSAINSIHCCYMYFISRGCGYHVVNPFSRLHTIKSLLPQQNVIPRKHHSFIA